MADVNEYANRFLLDLTDELHSRIRVVLEAKFGTEWFQKAVETHLARGSLDRVREMLSSPMRVVDMAGQMRSFTELSTFGKSLPAIGRYSRKSSRTRFELRRASRRSLRSGTTSHTGGPITTFHEASSFALSKTVGWFCVQ